MELKDEGIVLRPATEADAEHIVSWRNQPNVKKYFFHQDPLTIDSHLEWFNRSTNAGEVVMFVIEDTETDKPVGATYLSRISQKDQKAEFGFFIGEDAARGKGLGSKSCELTLRYAFEKLGLNRVVMRMMGENIPSYRAGIRCGLKQEGIMQEDVFVDGRFQDVIVLAMLKKEYFSKHPQQ